MTHRPRLLPVALAAALLGPAAAVAQTPDYSLCRAPDAIPPFRPQPDAPTPREGAPVEIDADELDVSEQQRTLLSGGVELRRADQWLATDALEWLHDTGRYRTFGGARYQDPSLRFIAADMEGDLERDEHRLTEVTYQLVAERGNGRADEVRLRGEGIGEMDNASFSTCDPERRSWDLRADNIRIDQEAGVGVARNARVYLGRVPVMYTPWLQFPIDDRRRSGLLYPTLGYSDESGIEFRQPVYLNLAPNYDATLTPALYGRRGAMLGAEFRYLSTRHRGTIEGNVLPNDRVADRDRAALRARHSTRLNAQWSARANIWRVSDTDYLEDFSERSQERALEQIRSTAGLYGRGRTWDARVEASSYQLTDSLLGENALQYDQLPGMRLRYRQPFGHWLELGFRGEAIAFAHPTRVEGRRVDLKPSIALPLEGDAWFVRPELAWRYTAWDIDREVNDSPTRSLPVKSLDMGAFFERPVSLFGQSLLQTLEPRLYYLHVPFRDQADIPVFDSRELTFGYAQLFRDNRFSGGDRQADAHQATAAVTSRLVSRGSGREVGALSVGQIRYFDTPRVGLPGRPAPDARQSEYVAELELLPDDRWSFRTTQTWDPNSSQSTLSAYRLQYRFDRGTLVNASYRYRRDVLEQADVSFVHPLNERWRVVGRWNHALDDSTTIEGIGGVEWQGCCVAVRLLGRHYVRNRQGDKGNAIYLEIELKGLGSIGRRTDDLLERAILDYSR